MVVLQRKTSICYKAYVINFSGDLDYWFFDNLLNLLCGADFPAWVTFSRMNTISGRMQKEWSKSHRCATKTAKLLQAP
jgi:hypothetical protein